MVSRDQAERVIAAEKDAYDAAIEGLYGLEEQERAQKLRLGPQRDERGSLRGIVECVTEQKDYWEVTCLVTSQEFVRPFASETEGELAARLQHNKELANYAKAEARLEPVMFDFLIERLYRLENPGDKSPTPGKVAMWLNRVGEELLLKKRTAE